MGCLETILKAILIITNVVVIIAGLALLVIGGIFLNQNFDFLPDLADYSTSVDAVLIPMMVLGGLLLIIGLIGCIGACSGKAGLLNFYFIILLIIVVLEIAIVIVCIVKRDDVQEAAVDGATDIFSRYLTEYFTDYTCFGCSAPDNITATEAFAVNVFQAVVGCCGLTNGSVYWSANGQSGVPPGCCSDWTGEDTNSTDFSTYTVTSCSAESLGTEYTDGCTEKVESLMSEFGVVVIVVCVAVIVFELICMCAACYSKKNDMVA